MSDSSYRNKQAKALALNFIVPGLGQRCLRQWTAGTILPRVLLVRFIGRLVAFATLMNAGFGMFAGDLLAGSSRHPSAVFHAPCLTFFAAASVADHARFIVIVWTAKPVGDLAK
jgi:uncharacterized membrane protein YjjP (DUF1212 family)